MKAQMTDDPYLWLEGVTDPLALEWVAAENQRTCMSLEALPDYAPTRGRLLQILDSNERIPGVVAMGPWYYGFWRDERNVRGVFRRTTPEEYRKAQPGWETVLDLDALAAAEGENWVWSGASGLYPDYRRLLISLSRGGGDTVVVREYDIEERRFVDGGFEVPAAKTRVSWIDVDTLYVCTDFGPGTLTDSGYPRVAKRWKRGTPLEEAVTVFEAEKSDVSVGATRSRDWIDGRLVWRDFLWRSVTFHRTEMFLLVGGMPVRLDVPMDAGIDIFQDQILVTLRSDWTVPGGGQSVTWLRGSVIAESLSAFLAGRREFQQLFAAGERRALRMMQSTRHVLLMHVADNLENRLLEWRYDGTGWQMWEGGIERNGTFMLAPVNTDTSDDYFVTTADALTPTTLSIRSAGSDTQEVLKRLPACFDSDGMRSTIYEAVSTDGERIPYCLVTPKHFTANARTPTLLYAYGGFEHAQLPMSYSAGTGACWLERGGAFVVAGIRGGGEFGAAWHQAALREKRQRAYDDFIAVAEDLAARRVTSPQQLGIKGGSNGGLLVGAVMVQRPELFGAVVCQVPLLDMRRYHRLLAGASWMAEFGDPDQPTDWEFLSRYSPYQNVRAHRRYPKVLFTTSTRDDRVHPGHARKMMARMKEQGHDVWYFENTEGGHAGAANNVQVAKNLALEFAFLWRALC